MRKILTHVLVLCLVFGFPLAPSADMRWVWQGGEKKWQSHLEADYRPGQHDQHALVLSPFMTLAQDDKSLIFLNIRNTLFWKDADFAHEINAGGGYRRLMGDSASWILGGYAFYDRLDSLNENKFDQGTIGMEALSQDFDVRMNAYIADMEKKEVGNRARSVELDGNNLRLNSNVEQSMSGFDAEVGWRLPFATDSLLGDTRVYAGGFFFDASKVSSLGGPQARFETRIHEVPFLWEGSRITLGAEYTWDEERNSEVTGLISLRIPIGPPSRSAPLTYVERRMTDRVVRDVAVVSDLGAGSNESVVTRTGAAIDDVYFFDATTADPDCSFDAPCDITTAVATGENNLLIGLNRTGDVTAAGQQLEDGQTVMGGGSTLIVYGEDSGQRATFTAPGGPATLCCTAGTALNLARYNTIVGLIFDGVGTALAWDDLDASPNHLDIYDNSFRNLGVPTAVSLVVDNGAPLEAWITNNLIENMPVGIDVTAVGTFDVDLTIEGNTFRNVGTGIQASLNPTGVSGPSRWQDVIADNRFEDSDAGIEVDVYFQGSEDYTHVSSVTGNYFRNLDWDGYELHVSGNSPAGLLDLQVNVAGNHAEDLDNFFDFELDPIPSGQVNLEVVENDIENLDDDAIDIDIDQGPDVTVDISRNNIREINGDAIQIDILQSGDVNGHTVTIADNQISDIDDDGMDVDFNQSLDANVSVTGNDLASIGDDAVNVEIIDTGHSQGNTADVSDNTIADVDDDAIHVRFYGGYDATVSVADNEISDAGDDGIQVDFYDNGHSVGSTASVTGNVVSHIEDEGIDVYFYNSYDGTVTVADNEVSETGDDGIEIEFDDNGHNVGNTASVTGNVITDADGDGIDFNAEYNNFDTNVAISDNQITSSGDSGSGDAIHMEFYQNYGNVGDTATVTDNEIDGAEDDGIDVSFEYSYDGTVTVASNVIRDVSYDGIDIEFYDNGHNLGNTASVTGNEIDGAGDDGIDVYDYNNAYTSIDISGNEINNSEFGIEVDLYQTYAPTVTIASNDINEVERDGIDVYLNATGSSQVTIEGNEVSGSAIHPDPQNCGGCGIGVLVENDSDNNEVVINGNQIQHSDFAGIAIDAEDSSDSNTFRIGGNAIDQSDVYGIYVYSSQVSNVLTSEVDGSVENNEVSDSGIADAAFAGTFTGTIRVNGVDVP